MVDETTLPGVPGEALDAARRPTPEEQGPAFPTEASVLRPRNPDLINIPTPAEPVREIQGPAMPPRGALGALADWTETPRQVAGTIIYDNSVVSGIRTAYDTWGMQRDESYNPYPDMEGYEHEFDPTFRLRAAYVGSRAEMDVLKRRYQEERDNDMIRAQHPIWALTEGFALGFADPPNWLPGGAVYRAGKLGLGVARSAAEGALYGAIGGAFGEGIAQATHYSRTPDDYLTSTIYGAGFGAAFGTGGSILSGILGSSAKQLSKPEFDRIARNLEAGPVTEDTLRASAAYQDVHAQLKAAGLDDQEAGANAVVMAAANDTRAKRLGVSADDLWRSEGPEIRAGEAPGDLNSMKPQEIVDSLVQSHVSEPAEAGSVGSLFIDPQAKTWDLFHGTTALNDFERFDPSSEASQIGTSLQGAERGVVFLTPNPKEAGRYASFSDPEGEAGARIFRVSVDPGKTAVFDIPQLLRSGDERFAVALKDAWARYDLGGNGRGLDAEMSAAKLMLDRTDMDHPAVDHTLGATHAAIDLARKDGLDTVVVRGLNESGGGDQVIVLNPDRVFSRYSGKKLYQFAGERAKTADLKMLSFAKSMEDRGKDQDVIWMTTGWGRGADGKWRFEIPDNAAKLDVKLLWDRLDKNEPVSVRDVYSSPELEAAYPDLFDIPIERLDAPGILGGYDTLTNKMELNPDAGTPRTIRSTILHELQHAIQAREGHGRGGSSAWMAYKYKVDADAAEDLYRRIPGEVEARTTQARADLTADQRLNRPPWRDEDVPREDQISYFQSATGDNRTGLFDRTMAHWRGQVGRILRGAAKDPVTVLRRSPVLSTVFGGNGKVTLDPIRANAIRGKHADIPGAVWHLLPRLLADPEFAFTMKDGRTMAVLSVTTKDGSPIIVGIKDGEIATVTPWTTSPSGETGWQRLGRELDVASQRPGRIYAKTAEALEASRNGRGVLMGSNSPDRPLTALTEGIRRPGLGKKVFTRDDVVKAQGGVFYQDDVAGAPRGAISFGTSKALIQLFKDKDASTFIHEGGHLWFQQMIRDADVSPEIKADLDTVLEWLGVDDASKITREHHEKWAAAVEQYMRDGKAPSSALQRAFDQFREWLTSIYKALTDLGEPIPDDIRGVMDRLLAVEEKRPQEATGGFGGSGGAAYRYEDANRLKSTLGIAEVAGKAPIYGSPIAFAQTSPFAAVRRMAEWIGDGRLAYEKNAEGIATAADDATGLRGNLDDVKRLSRARHAELTRNIEDLYSQYRFGRDKRMGDNVRRMMPDPAHLDYDAFKAEVWQAANMGDRHAIPEVAAAAREFRKVADALADRAVDVGIWNERPAPVGADSYAPHIFNTRLVAAREQEFVADTAAFYARDQVTKARLQDRMKEIAQQQDAITKSERKLLDQIKALEKKEHAEPAHDAAQPSPQRQKLEVALQDAHRQGEVLRSKMEGIIAAWDGTSSKAAKRALDKRASATAGMPDGAPRLKTADAAVSDAAEAILRARTDLSPDELKARAQETWRRVVGTPAGRFAYDDQASTGSAISTGKEQLGRTFQERQFAMPFDVKSKWLERDIDYVSRSMIEQMEMDIAIVERFGEIQDVGGLKMIRSDGTTQFKEIVEEAQRQKEAFASLYEAKHGKPPTPAQIEANNRKLTDRANQDIDTLQKMLERQRGMFGVPSDPRGLGHQAANIARGFNIMTSLGSVLVSSVSDLATPLMRHGLIDLLGSGWAPYVAMTGKEIRKRAVSELKLMGVGLELELQGRLTALNDIVDDYGRGSMAERATTWSVNNFMTATGLPQWTDVGERVVGYTAMTKILKAAKAVSDGTGKPAHVEMLADLGISPDTAKRIWSSFSADNGGERFGGMWLTNTGAWDDGDAAQAMAIGVGRAVERAIVRPGQERPFWSQSNDVGKLVFQFQSFMTATAQTVLLAGIQQRNARAVMAMAAMIGLGALSYQIRQVLQGREPSDDPKKLVLEGLSASGLLGWLEQVNTVAEKASGGHVGMSALTGEFTSRHMNYGLAGTLGGPVAGKAEDAFTAIQNISKGQASGYDVNKLRRSFLPGQNYWLLRGAIDDLEDGLSRSMGLKPRKRTLKVGAQ